MPTPNGSPPVGLKEKRSTKSQWKRIWKPIIRRRSQPSSVQGLWNPTCWDKEGYITLTRVGARVGAVTSKMFLINQENPRSRIVTNRGSQGKELLLTHFQMTEYSCGTPSMWYYAPSSLMPRSGPWRQKLRKRRMILICKLRWPFCGARSRLVSSSTKRIIGVRCQIPCAVERDFYDPIEVVKLALRENTAAARLNGETIILLHFLSHFSEGKKTPFSICDVLLFLSPISSLSTRTQTSTYRMQINCVRQPSRSIKQH